VIYEWDAAKASANLRKHKVSFAEAASVFLDPLALSFFDPDHSEEENREITIGISSRKRALFVSHCERGVPERNDYNMRRGSAKEVDDELRPEYDLSQLKGGVRGKYYKRAMAGTNLVLIEPDLAKAFPDTDSVNRALRLLVDAASSATTRRRQRRSASNKRIKRTA